MDKTLFTLEYPLKSASINILWNLISTPMGLSEWFADGITVKDDREFTFLWGKNEETAFLIESKQNVSVRFQWDEDANTDYFFEIRIVVIEVTGDLSLLITDFAEPDEKADAIFLWNHLIEILCRKAGM